MRHGRNIVLEQRPRAESDIAVAAASIIAREGFINWLERKSKELGMRLERGVSPGVKETAKKLVEMSGPEALREVVKVHFRTAHEIAPEYYAAPPDREDCRRRTSPKISHCSVASRLLLNQAPIYEVSGLQKIAFLCFIWPPAESQGTIT